MRRPDWTPSMVPSETNQEVYLVVDDFGSLGRAWRETDVGETDLETVMTDLLQGQFCNPVRVVGFNVAEGWCRDVSEDVARELQKRCADQDRDVPSYLQDFIFRHAAKSTVR